MIIGVKVAELVIAGFAIFKLNSQICDLQMGDRDFGDWKNCNHIIYEHNVVAAGVWNMQKNWTTM